MKGFVLRLDFHRECCSTNKIRVNSWSPACLIMLCSICFNSFSVRAALHCQFHVVTLASFKKWIMDLEIPGKFSTFHGFTRWVTVVMDSPSRTLVMASLTWYIAVCVCGWMLCDVFLCFKKHLKTDISVAFSGLMVFVKTGRAAYIFLHFKGRFPR